MGKVNALIIENIKKFLTKTSESGIRIRAAYLFGSCSKGTENKWSDIDVAIISSDLTNNRFQERVRLMKLASHIDTRIEPVPFTPATFTDDDPLAWEIKRNGIKLMP